MAKGFFGARSRLLRTATEAVNKAMKYAFRDVAEEKENFADYGSRVLMRLHNSTIYLTAG